MEAARGAMAAISGLAQQRADAGLRKTVAGLLISRGAALQALQLSSEPLAQARTPFPAQAPGTALPVAPAADVAAGPEAEALLQSIGEHAAAAAAAVAQERSAEALKSFEGLAAAFRALGDRACEAAALTALSSALAACGGDRRDAFRAASAAVKAARAVGDKPGLIAALEGAVSTSFAFGDPDEALRAATEVAALASQGGDRRAEARARLAAASAQLATGDAQAAMEASFQALELCRALGDKQGQAMALSVAYDVNVLLGRPAAAAGSARDALALARGDRRAEAAASLLVGGVGTAERDALDACQQALSLYQGLGDKAGEAAAKLAVANAHLSKQDGKEADQGLASAKEALAAFKGLGSRSGEAVALATVAAAYIQKGEAAEAEEAGREALSFFRELRDSVGEAYTTSLLKEAKVVAAKPSPASVRFEEATSIAHVEVSDGSSGASLRGVVEQLQMSKGLSCIVLHINGATDPATPPGSGRDFGLFLMGLRMLGLPVVASVCGRISGPMWAFVLTCDYRIAATTSTFICPLWGKPECMRSFLGHNVLVQLCMSTGPKDSLVMLESGVVHQLQKGAADTRTAAAEMAKRVVATPSMACRKQPFVLNQSVEEYAMAAIQGKGVC